MLSLYGIVPTAMPLTLQDFDLCDCDTLPFHTKEEHHASDAEDRDSSVERVDPEHLGR
jgi:hypothetical protein